MTQAIKDFWGSLDTGIKTILFIMAMLTSFGSGQFILYPQVKSNKEISSDNKMVINEMSKSIEFLTRVSVATAKNAGIDTEEIRKSVDIEFRKLKAWSK